jgi:hypothetical protein
LKSFIESGEHLTFVGPRSAIVSLERVVRRTQR